MKYRNDILKLIEYFQKLEEKPLEFDEEAIVSAYKKDDGNQTLAIKILSIFGGILASLAFLGFLFIAGFYDSGIGLSAFGIIFITASVWLSNLYNKIIIDPLSVSSFFIGFLFVGVGSVQLDFNEDLISILFLLIALGVLAMSRNYILCFVSVLIVNGSILALIISNDGYDFIHIYVSALALILTYLLLKEAKIITSVKRLSHLYNPVRIGLTFSFLAGLALLGIKGMLPLSREFIWLSSFVIISVIAYLISLLFKVLDITEKRTKITIYGITLLTILPTALSPAISGAILLIVLGFLVNYKTGLILGIVSFIYFISQYYYDLNFTLLTKSILLFLSGILFVLLYLLTHKKLSSNEKV